MAHSLWNFSRPCAIGLALLSSLAALSCGGGGNGGSSGSGGGPPPPAANEVAVIVDSGPDPATNATVNTLYTTVTVCVPGSTNQCQTIDHIQVDTQSNGLRILASVLTLSLPVTMASAGNSLVECAQFASGYSWGPVAMADMQVSGEKASSIPIQVIGSANFAAVPAACSAIGPAEDTVTAFGANGLLGIGVFAQDCGPGCPASSGFYYSCSQNSCVEIAPPTQVENPVPLFATDNNGSIIDLPSVVAPGAVTLSGSLIFGIDTQSNNASGAETVLTVDPGMGTFTTVFSGKSFGSSIIDSGSNGTFFDDSGSNTSIIRCSSTGTNSNSALFYCPNGTLKLSATLTGLNGVNFVENFSVDNAQTLFKNYSTFSVMPTLSGTYSASATTFDWGLPFFYGRRIATAIEGRTTSVATGPYMAF